jgi:hypothetical protein
MMKIVGHECKCEVWKDQGREKGKGRDSDR